MQIIQISTSYNELQEESDIYGLSEEGKLYYWGVTNGLGGWKLMEDELLNK